MSDTHRFATNFPADRKTVTRRLSSEAAHAAPDESLKMTLNRELFYKAFAADDVACRTHKTLLHYRSLDVTRQRQKTTTSENATGTPAYAAFIGLDWADEKHAICLCVGDDMEHATLDQSPQAIREWVASLKRRFGGRKVAVCLEQSRGAVAYALMEHPQLEIFPINPKQAAYYRQALANSGKKSDPLDAEAMARFLRDHHADLRPWRPNDELTQTLANLSELRRKAVNSRVKEHLRLVGTLKTYFPAALDIMNDWSETLAHALLLRWPTLRELQRANPRTIKAVVRDRSRCRNEAKLDALVKQIRAAQPLTTNPAVINPTAAYVQMLVRQIDVMDASIREFDQAIADAFAKHPDAEIFRSPPGAGKAMAPRLLAAFGSDRSRFTSAEDVQCYAGIAPIIQESGKSRRVLKRFACNTFLRQTFHEFADQARRWSRWSKAYYRSLKARGMSHHAALRSLAFKWIRILFRCWQDRVPYDEQRYLNQLRRKNVPYLKFLETT